MDFNSLYTDFWELIAHHLSSDDLYAFSLTCKQANRAVNRKTVQQKISYPMLYPYKLTYEQRELIRKMEVKDIIFKLINGDVGSGKTITSTSYAIRNYSDPESKVVMCGPPGLIKMWWVTLRKYFGIEPAVLHGTDNTYSTKSWDKVPGEKFILISYRLLQMKGHVCRQWFDNTRDLLIIDEAHHRVGVDHSNFKEIIGLSATTTKKTGLARGIRGILRSFDLEEKDCTFALSKNIIAKKLPPVVYHPYMLPITDELKRACKLKINYTRTGDQDLISIAEMCKLLAHPLILDLNNEYTGGYIMVGRKRFVVDGGSYHKYMDEMDRIRTEYPDLNSKQRKDMVQKNATFNISKSGLNYHKYVQAYHIIKKANSKGEKVILFDNSTKHLPFLYKFLIDCGINSFIFSTHYGVEGRQRQLEKFKEDKNPGVLLSSIEMLGEGQNVTEANHVIFLSHCLDHTKYYQGVGRCWRYPQEKVVNVHLLFSGMFERKIYEHACGGEACDIRSSMWVDLIDQ